MTEKIEVLELVVTQPESSEEQTLPVTSEEQTQPETSEEHNQLT